ATFAPSAAARSAMARPMPRLPPDIRMVLPASFFSVTSSLLGWLSGRHADGAVEADRLAVEVAVLGDVLHEPGVLVGPPEPRGVGHLLSEGVLRLLGQAL